MLLKNNTTDFFQSLLVIRNQIITQLSRMKHSKTIFISLVSCLFLAIGCQNSGNSQASQQKKTNVRIADQDTFKVQKTEEEWKKILSPEEFEILRKAGTETPYNNEYEKHYESGIYVCAACGNKLFESNTKYESFCGWPSFWDTIDSTAITTRLDTRYGMERTEIVCAKCDGHLGHVFEDGPPPTGLRYCMNSVAMDFIPADSLK